MNIRAVMAVLADGALDHRATLVTLAVACHADRETGRAVLSRQTMADEMKVCRATVGKGLRTAKAAGVLREERHNGWSSTWTVVIHRLEETPRSQSPDPAISVTQPVTEIATEGEGKDKEGGAPARAARPKGGGAGARRTTPSPPVALTPSSPPASNGARPAQETARVPPMVQEARRLTEAAAALICGRCDPPGWIEEPDGSVRRCECAE